MKLKNFNNICNISFVYQNISKRSFCMKYIPLKKLKFEEIGYIEQASKIYENNINKIKKTNISLNSNKILSYILLSSLFISANPFSTIITNLLVQPILLIKRTSLKKVKTEMVDTIYILQNGHQILIHTFSKAVHIINIKDIINFQENENYDKITLKTSERYFIIELTNVNLLNEDILNAIKMRQIVNTVASYGNYHRNTFTK